MIRTALFQVAPATLGICGLAQCFWHLTHPTPTPDHPVRRWHYAVGLITAASAACSSPSAAPPPTMSHLGATPPLPTAPTATAAPTTAPSTTAPPTSTPSTAAPPTTPNTAPEAPAPDAEHRPPNADPIPDEDTASNQADPTDETAAWPEHTVLPGDTLWTIAHDHLTQHHATPVDPGTIATYWRQIIDLNQPRLQSLDPDLIYPGETILLPMI